MTLTGCLLFLAWGLFLYNYTVFLITFLRTCETSCYISIKVFFQLKDIGLIKSVCCQIEISRFFGMVPSRNSTRFRCDERNDWINARKVDPSNSLYHNNWCQSCAIFSSRSTYENWILHAHVSFFLQIIWKLGVGSWWLFLITLFRQKLILMGMFLTYSFPKPRDFMHSYYHTFV